MSWTGEERPLLRYRLGSFLLYLWSLTWRMNVEQTADTEVVPAELCNLPVIIAFWHGQMLPLWMFLSRLDPVPGAMISRSRDGGVLAYYLHQYLGFDLRIRGSSGKGGKEALEDVVGFLKERSIAITPDGPTGPAQIAKRGMQEASQRSGRPIVFIRWTTRYAIRFRSWDAMQLPLPFSRINIRYCIINPNTQILNPTP